MYSVKVIADSTFNGNRITTLECTYPYIIHAEMLTHRQFSRNSASFRAIPTHQLIKAVREKPFIPARFLENQPGMTGGEPLNDYRDGIARDAWKQGADVAADIAEELMEQGVHKQHATRVLLPYLWITTVITSTEWTNFFKQRCSPLAQPEMQRIASLMEGSMLESIPNETLFHSPYHENPQISAARCARVSYLNQGENRPEEADLALFTRLLENSHWSPLEHPAQVGSLAPKHANFTGWMSLRYCLENCVNAVHS